MTEGMVNDWVYGRNVDRQTARNKVIELAEANSSLQALNKFIAGLSGSGQYTVRASFSSYNTPGRQVVPALFIATQPEGSVLGDTICPIYVFVEDNVVKIDYRMPSSKVMPKTEEELFNNTLAALIKIAAFCKTMIHRQLVQEIVSVSPAKNIWEIKLILSSGSTVCKMVAFPATPGTFAIYSGKNNSSLFTSAPDIYCSTIQDLIDQVTGKKKPSTCELRRIEARIDELLG